MLGVPVMPQCIRLTVHARVRYVERCLGLPIAQLAGAAGVDARNYGLVWRFAVESGLVDPAAIGRALTTPHITAAIRCGAKWVDLGTGWKAVLADGHIVTIISKSVSAQRQKAHYSVTRGKRNDRKCSRDFKVRKCRERDHDHV